MKLKRCSDPMALALSACGSPELDENASAESDPLEPSWTGCGAALDHDAHCAQTELPVDYDAGPLTIEIALDWAQASRAKKGRRTAFERTLLRSLQARLRRGGFRSPRRRILP